MKRLILLVFAALSAATSPAVGYLPEIPPSKRILSTDEVRNFWLNHWLAKPTPPRPLGLHPAAQRDWDRRQAERSAILRSIRAGEHDDRARLTMLRHNAAAWRLRGDRVREENTLSLLRESELHLAKLESVEIQRRAVEETAALADAVARLEAEVRSLRASSGPGCD